MQETDRTHEQENDVPSRRRWTLRRFIFLYFVLLGVLLLAILPPLINVNRFQRRIATSIGASLGRPVHLDRVSLNLLPLPGFTLENFVVGEDAAFGSEPVIRANSVRATLRLSSLWSRRVEFSTISFTDPSVNLVHTSDGKWNLDSILLQASRIAAAPTAQAKAGPAPRFPYIEATGARVNLKLDQEKIPLSLTDADFALWLSDPQEWRLRIQAHPARTDTNVSDTGVLRVEGTLGRAASFGLVPIDLQGEWSGAPLGEASRVLLGYDAGLRGDMVLTASAHGIVSQSAVQARLQLNNARRADFVPDDPLAVDLECRGTAVSDFHGFEDVRCSWPPLSSTPTVAGSGSLPDIRRLSSGTFEVGTPGIPGSRLLRWLRVASARVPADVTAGGMFTGSVSCRPGKVCEGKMVLAEASLVNPRGGDSSLVTGDVVVGTPVGSEADGHRGKKRPVAAPSAGNVFLLSPMSLALGGKDPATLDGRIDGAGYTLHLTGMASIVRLQALAQAVPQFGDGLAEVLPTNRAAGPFRVDLLATRPWRGAQVWHDNLAPAVTPRGRRGLRSH